MLCGGFGQPKEITEEVEQLLQSLKAEVEAQLGSTFETFRGVSFTSQVVAGTNYLVQVDCGDQRTATVKIFKPLPHTQQPHQLSEASFN